MSTADVAGVLLVALPVAFNLAFGMLAAALTPPTYVARSLWLVAGGIAFLL